MVGHSWSLAGCVTSGGSVHCPLASRGASGTTLRRRAAVQQCSAVQCEVCNSSDRANRRVRRQSDAPCDACLPAVTQSSISAALRVRSCSQSRAAMSARHGRSGDSSDEDAPSQKRGRPSLASPPSGTTGSTSPVAAPFSFDGQFGPDAKGSFPTPSSVQVPDLVGAWARASQDTQSQQQSSGGGGFKTRSTRDGRRTSYSAADGGDEEAGEYEQSDPSRGKDKGDLSCMWVRLLPVRYGWPKLLLYIALLSVFAFLAFNYLLSVTGRSLRFGGGTGAHGVRQFDTDVESFDAAAELEEVRARLRSRGDMGEVLEKLDKVVNHAMKRSGEQTPKHSSYAGEEPTAAGTVDSVPPVVPRVNKPEVPAVPTESEPVEFTVAASTQPTVPESVTPPVVMEERPVPPPREPRTPLPPPKLPQDQPIPSYGRAAASRDTNPAGFIPGAPVAPEHVAAPTDASHAGGHLGHAGAEHKGVLPGDEGAMPEGGVEVLRKSTLR